MTAPDRCSTSMLLMDPGHGRGVKGGSGVKREKRLILSRDGGSHRTPSVSARRQKPGPARFRWRFGCSAGWLIQVAVCKTVEMVMAYTLCLPALPVLTLLTYTLPDTRAGPDVTKYYRFLYSSPNNAFTSWSCSVLHPIFQPLLSPAFSALTRQFVAVARSMTATPCGHHLEVGSSRHTELLLLLSYS